MAGFDRASRLPTILDPAVATASELAALDPRRWEVGIAIKESKNNGST